MTNCRFSAGMTLLVKHTSINWMSQLMLSGYHQQLGLFKFSLILNFVSFLTCVYQWIFQSLGILQNFSIVRSGLSAVGCLSRYLLSLLNKQGLIAANFLILVFCFNSCYKDYLSVNFPFGSYKQVFIEPSMAVSSLSVGASMSIFSSQILFDEKIIDQVPISLTCIF